MDILVIVDKKLPSDHSFINGVFNKILPSKNHNIIFLGLKNQGVILKDEKNVQYITCDTESNNVFINSIKLLNLFRKNFKTLIKFKYVFTRNSPGALIIGSIIKTINQQSYHVHQISHLHAEGLLDYSNRRIDIIKAYGDLIIRRIFIGKCNKVLAISDEMKKILIQKYPFLYDKITTFPLGILTSEFIDDVDFEKRTIDLVYIGTLAKERQIKEIVKAIKVYNEKYDKIVLYIWGDAPNKSDVVELKKYILDNALNESVIINSPIPRSEVLEKLKQSQIGICTVPPIGIMKTISPTKMMEYMAAGCVVIGTYGILEIEQIINESQAGVLTDFNASKIADAIHQLKSNPQMCKQMMQDSKNYILRKRSYENMYQRIFEESTSL